MAAIGGFGHRLQTPHDGLIPQAPGLPLQRRRLHQFVDVGARHEGFLARAGEDERPVLGVVLDAPQRVVEFAHRGDAQRVELVRTVDREGGNPVFRRFEKDVGVEHRLTRPTVS